MSRTIRKTDYISTRSRISHRNRELEYYYRRGFEKTIKVRRTEEEYNILESKVNSKYQEELKEYYKKINSVNPLYWFTIRKPYEPYVSKYKRVLVSITFEEVIAEADKEYLRWTRDQWSETSRNSGFKRDAARTVRRANKSYCKKVLQDEWEELVAPNGHEGDHLIWNYW